MPLNHTYFAFPLEDKPKQYSSQTQTDVKTDNDYLQMMNSILPKNALEVPIDGELDMPELFSP